MAASARGDDAKPNTPGQTGNPLKAEAISLPGGQGGIGFDDIAYAPSLHQVVVPAAQKGRVYLIDPETRSYESCAVWQGRTTSADAGDGYVFATDRTHSAVNVIDPRLHKVVATATLAMEPDIVRYVPATHEVWVTEEDPKKGQVEILAFSADGSVRLSHVAAVKVTGGGPESLAVDPLRSRVYTNREDQKRTVAIDIPTHQIVAEWKNGTENSSSGLALDEKQAWLFVGSGGGGVAVLDVAHDGRVLGTLKVGKGTDIISYNPSVRHVYVPDPKEGTLAIIGLSPGGEPRLLGTVETVKGSHAAAADNHGQVWVTDPGHGQILVVKDTL
jgi:DNA-binding beta-propeller fold protein YncE